MTANLVDIFKRATEVVGIVPDVIQLYQDIASDKTLNDPDNVIAILDFIDSKSEKFEKYCSHGEVLMLVCGVLGMVSAEDTSELYLELLNKASEKKD